ncbi:hypothetical protein [Caulobacter segnis]|jgi:hypothetical protein|uniref:hypothetical protein n=1 Tax=Caulobacter segnis TaxID=88688 RepID=UPI001CC13F0E|nr:hypothetical protein [Caulobacter segnis]UAL11664.1 hypothetical protein K8940_05090 [Caulobacter segnis]
MTTADWALAISLLSFCVALASFIWNVWSKFIYPKPKVEVSFGVMRSYQQGEEPSAPFLTMVITNHGPGSVKAHMAIVRGRRRFFKRRAMGVLNPIHNFPFEPYTSHGPFSGGLPKAIDVGEELQLHFPFERGGFLADELERVGFVDTFGRNHWVRRRVFHRAVIEHRKAFPTERPQAKSNSV